MIIHGNTRKSPAQIPRIFIQCHLCSKVAWHSPNKTTPKQMHLGVVLFTSTVSDSMSIQKLLHRSPHSFSTPKNFPPKIL